MGGFKKGVAPLGAYTLTTLHCSSRMRGRSRAAAISQPESCPAKAHGFSPEVPRKPYTWTKAEWDLKLISQTYHSGDRGTVPYGLSLKPKWGPSLLLHPNIESELEKQRQTDMAEPAPRSWNFPKSADYTEAGQARGKGCQLGTVARLAF